MLNEKDIVAPATEHGITRASRVSLAVPRAKLAVPEIPGYKCHWFRGDQRVEAAIQAGWEFVSKKETAVQNHGVAADRNSVEGSDLGSRVSSLAGGLDEGSNQPSRLYLMKLRNEWAEDDAKARGARSDLMVEALRGGNAGRGEAGALDMTNRYTGAENRNIFKKRS